MVNETLILWPERDHENEREGEGEMTLQGVGSFAPEGDMTAAQKC